MTGPTRELQVASDLDHREALAWYADRYHAVYASRNRWLVTAWGALGLSAVQAVALACLMPLKTAVPFLVKEEVSGAVTTVTRLTGDPSVTYSEAVRKYFLGRYVTQRETVDRTDLADNYRAVERMSGPEEQRAFESLIAATNPASPIRLYNAQERRLIHIKSITFLSPEVAQIRFAAVDERRSTPMTSTDWIATAAFHFGSVPSLEADRLINPLGFAVTHYRLDPEVIQ